MPAFDRPLTRSHRLLSLQTPPLLPTPCRATASLSGKTRESREWVTQRRLNDTSEVRECVIGGVIIRPPLFGRCHASHRSLVFSTP
ncbi:hypothetical protein BHM03_00040832 [Ensete ventricosum]|nr:hypothetical protein BHM03_00040832 [Ensete ventricosum]